MSERQAFSLLELETLKKRADACQRDGVLVQMDPRTVRDLADIAMEDLPITAFMQLPGNPVGMCLNPDHNGEHIKFTDCRHWSAAVPGSN